jgi:hypothetical protein
VARVEGSHTGQFLRDILFAEEQRVAAD